MQIRLSNVWENIIDIVEWVVDAEIKQKYKTKIFTPKWELKVSELDFLREVLLDFSRTVTFRFLFDYTGKQKREIISLVELDIDLVINKLMVDLFQTKNSAGVLFNGSDHVEDVERYRYLDDRIVMMDDGSVIDLQVAWLQDWMTANDTDTDEPDQKALEAIYNKFLRISGYMNEYEMVGPAVLLSDLLESQANAYEFYTPQPEKPTRTKPAKSDKNYSELASTISTVIGDNNEMIFWLMEFTGEYKSATGKVANIQALDKIYTTFYIESGLIDTMPDLDAFGLLKSLENNS